jgi:hypothetical protein
VCLRCAEMGRDAGSKRQRGVTGQAEHMKCQGLDASYIVDGVLGCCVIREELPLGVVQASSWCVVVPVGAGFLV